MGKQVYTKEERRAQFIKTGIAIAKVKGVDGLSISAVAEKHKVTPPLVFHIFGDRAKFRAVIAAEAKKQGIELKGADAPTPKRKRSAKEVQAIKRKEGAKGKAVKKAAPTAGNGAPLRQRGKKPAAPPSKSAKFAKLPVPAGEAVDTNLSPKV